MLNDPGASGVRDGSKPQNDRPGVDRHPRDVPEELVWSPLRRRCEWPDPSRKTDDLGSAPAIPTAKLPFGHDPARVRFQVKRGHTDSVEIRTFARDTHGAE